MMMEAKVPGASGSAKSWARGGQGEDEEYFMVLSLIGSATLQYSNLLGVYNIIFPILDLIIKKKKKDSKYPFLYEH